MLKRLWIKTVNKLKLYRYLPCWLGAHQWMPDEFNACWGLSCQRCPATHVIRDLVQESVECVERGIEPPLVITRIPLYKTQQDESKPSSREGSIPGQAQ